jgi:hypothetical protein
MDPIKEKPSGEIYIDTSSADPIYHPVRKKQSPFLEAAGMVLSVGFGVLRIIGKGIKASTKLLLQSKVESPRQGSTKTMKAIPDDQLPQTIEKA